MNFLSKIIQTTVDAGHRIAQVLRLGNRDVQDADIAMPFGIDSNPIKDTIGVYSETATKGEPVIIGYLLKETKAETGETRIFSVNASGVEQTYLWLKNDGTMEMAGDTDNLVRYSALQSAFNQLRTDLNNHIAIYNTHVHTGGTISGSTGTTATPSTPSGADISGAKINEIKTL